MAHILYVDGGWAVGDALAGHDVDVAGSRDEALALLRGHSYDLVLLHPDDDLAGVLAAEHPGTRRLVLTDGTRLRRDVDEALVSVDARIRKAELRRRFENWRRGRTSADVTELAASIDRAVTIEQVLDAADEFEAVQDRFTE